MPSNVQYQPYNTRGTLARETNIQLPPDHGNRTAPESQDSRESVVDLLDAYYEDPEAFDEMNRGASSASPSYSSNALRNDTTQGLVPTKGPPGSYPAYQRPNFSRPQPIASGPPMSTPASDNGYNPPSDFSQLALRSRSHPDLHSKTPQIPYMSPNEVRNQARADGPQYSAPMIPQYPRRADSTMQKPGLATPSTAAPSISGDALPVHPEPEVVGEFEGTRYGNPYNHGQSHPPPPIRPGLVMDMNHPPPQRQYDVEKDRLPLGPESGPVTHQELEQLASAVKMNPGDPKLHLTYAKKLVEAATVLASEGGRADVKTTRKNRENYTYEAHKIIKKLTNSVSHLDTTRLARSLTYSVTSRIPIPTQSFT